MLHHEQKAWASGARRVAGIDEAGRGPLAGPVVAAAVHIEKSFLLEAERDVLAGLTDSKQLAPARRLAFFDLLQALPAVTIGVGQGSESEIDELNILRTTHLAMRRALDALPAGVDHVLVDGRPVPGLPCPSTPLVGGDAVSLSIAAASVVAKVTRDRLMDDLDAVFPLYGFGRHKGYGTPQHLAALRQHGPAPCHRRSFRPVAQLLLPLDLEGGQGQWAGGGLAS